MPDNHATRSVRNRRFVAEGFQYMRYHLRPSHLEDLAEEHRLQIDNFVSVWNRD